MRFGVRTNRVGAQRVDAPVARVERVALALELVLAAVSGHAFGDRPEVAAK